MQRPLHFPYVEYSLSIGVVLPPLLIFLFFFCYFIKLVIQDHILTTADDENVSYKNLDDQDDQQQQQEQNRRFSKQNKAEDEEETVLQRKTNDDDDDNDEQKKTTKNSNIRFSSLASLHQQNENNLSSSLLYYYSLPTPIPTRLNAFFNWCRRIRIINVSNATLGATLLVLLASSPSRYLFQECFQYDNDFIQNSTMFSVSPQAAIGSPFYYFCFGLASGSPSYIYNKDHGRSSYAELPDDFALETKLLEVVSSSETTKNESITTARRKCPFFIQNVTFYAKISSIQSETNYREMCNYMGSSQTRDMFSNGGWMGTSDQVATMIILSQNGNEAPSQLEGYLPFPVTSSSSSAMHDTNFFALFTLLVTTFGIWGSWLLLFVFQIPITIFCIPKSQRTGFDWGLLLPGLVFIVGIIRPVKSWKYFGMKSRDNNNNNNNKTKEVMVDEDKKNEEQSSPLSAKIETEDKNDDAYGTSPPENQEELSTSTILEENKMSITNNVESHPGELSYEMCNIRISNFFSSLFSVTFVVFIISFLICADAYGWFLTPASGTAAAVGMTIGLALCSVQFSITFIPALYHFFDFLCNRGPRLIRRKFILEYVASFQDLPFDSTFQKVKKIYSMTALPRRIITLMTTCVRIVYVVLIFTAFAELRDIYKIPSMRYAYAAQIMSYIVLAFETVRQFIGMTIVFLGWFEEKLGTRNSFGFLKDTTMGLFFFFLMDPEKNILGYLFRKCQYEDEFATTSNYYVRVFITVAIEFCHCYDALVANILQGKDGKNLDDGNDTTTTTEAPPLPSNFSTTTVFSTTPSPSSSAHHTGSFYLNLSAHLTRLMAILSLMKVGGSFFYLIYRQAELDYNEHKKEEQENENERKALLSSSKN